MKPMRLQSTAGARAEVEAVGIEQMAIYPVPTIL